MELRYQELYQMNRVEARRKLLALYEQLGSVSAVARAAGTSRQVVRKWLRRYRENGESGLRDLSRRPYHSPRQTPHSLEELVIDQRQRTGYGPKRLCQALAMAERIHLSPHTIRHILRRAKEVDTKKKRAPCYPARWAWEETGPFSLVQVDTKDIYDAGTLGRELLSHLRRHRLPRYQWTFCDGFSRFRLLAFSHQLTITNALCFLSLALIWLRRFGIEGPIQLQTDWGQEFGGSNLEKIHHLNQQFFAPLGATLCRYPLGRKGYNGRVERSHRTDDEEFYLPLLQRIHDEYTLVTYAAKWQYYYNVQRSHSGYKMEGLSPLQKLNCSGYHLPKSFATFLPLVLDHLSTYWQLNPGNDVLAHYRQ